MCERSDRPARPFVRCWRAEGPNGSPGFPPGRLFCGCFSGFPLLLDEIQPRLEEIAGPVRATSEVFDFPETRLYAPVMGADLKKVFYVFDGLFPQDCLGEVKRLTCRLEEEIASARSWPARRPINLDPGLVSEGRLVLASTKDRGHRLPRADGIYEEITLLFFDGSFQPLLWTYPDFREPACLAFFEAVRKEYLAETREVRRRFREAAERERF